MNDKDRAYFMHLLYVCNDTKRKENARRTYERYMASNKTEGGLTSFRSDEQLVNIFAFALMPNHYHLLVQQIVDDGIAAFMQRVGTGYTMYFNLTQSRSGSLFQGTYKRALVNDTSYMLHIPHYIHANPVVLTEEIDSKSVYNFLTSYKWCSLRDYAGYYNYGSVLHKQFLEEVYGGSAHLLKDFRGYVEEGLQNEHVPPGLLLDA